MSGRDIAVLVGIGAGCALMGGFLVFVLARTERLRLGYWGHLVFGLVSLGVAVLCGWGVNYWWLDQDLLVGMWGLGILQVVLIGVTWAVLLLSREGRSLRTRRGVWAAFPGYLIGAFGFGIVVGIIPRAPDDWGVLVIGALCGLVTLNGLLALLKQLRPQDSPTPEDQPVTPGGPPGA